MPLLYHQAEVDAEDRDDGSSITMTWDNDGVIFMPPNTLDDPPSSPPSSAPSISTDATDTVQVDSLDPALQPPHLLDIVDFEQYDGELENPVTFDNDADSDSIQVDPLDPAQQAPHLLDIEDDEQYHQMPESYHIVDADPVDGATPAPPEEQLFELPGPFAVLIDVPAPTPEDGSINVWRARCWQLSQELHDERLQSFHARETRANELMREFARSQEDRRELADLRWRREGWDRDLERWRREGEWWMVEREGWERERMEWESERQRWRGESEAWERERREWQRRCHDWEELCAVAYQEMGQSFE